MQDKLVPFQWLESSARGSEFAVLPLIELRVAASCFLKG